MIVYACGKISLSGEVYFEKEQLGRESRELSLVTLPHLPPSSSPTHQTNQSLRQKRSLFSTSAPYLATKTPPKLCWSVLSPKAHSTRQLKEEKNIFFTTFGHRQIPVLARIVHLACFGVSKSFDTICVERDGHV